MPDLLKVECPHCLGSLKLKDRSADGKKVRCPKCQEVFKVQLPAEDELDELDELQDDFGGEEEYQDEEPAPKAKGAAKKSSKKKKKSSGAKIPWAIIGIGAAVLLLLGGLGFVVSRFSLNEGSNKLDLTYLLPDANMVAHVKVQEFLASPLLAGVLSQPFAKQMLTAPADKNGFGFNEMVSITIGSKIDTPSSRMSEIMDPMGAMRRPRPTPANTHSVTVVRTSVPIPVDKMTADKAVITAQTHNGKTYHKRNGARTTGFGGDEADSFYIPEPNILVLAMEADLKLVIDQGSKQARRREFDIINPNSTLLMAGFKDPASASSAAPQPPTTTPPAAGMELAGKNLEQAANKTVQSGFAGIKFSDRIDFEVITTCADSAGAGDMKTALEGLFAELKTQFEKSKTLVTLSGMDEVIPLVDKSLASIKVEQTGSQVAMAASIPSDIKAVAESISKKMAGMAGGSPGTPPPGASVNFGPPGTSGGLPPGFDASQIPPGAVSERLPVDWHMLLGMVGPEGPDVKYIADGSGKVVRAEGNYRKSILVTVERTGAGYSIACANDWAVADFTTRPWFTAGESEQLRTLYAEYLTSKNQSPSDVTRIGRYNVAMGHDSRFKSIIAFILLSGD